MPPPDAPFEFFLNIWASSPPASPPASVRGPSASAGRKKRVRRDRRALVAAPLIDISQVAHVVTTMTDFRNDYAPLPMQVTNLWDDPALDLGTDPADTSAASIMSPIHSKSGRSDGDVSTSEEDASEASGVSAAFRPAPARLQPDGRAAQVVYPTADAGEASGASGAQLAKIKPADAAAGAATGAAPRALKDGGVVFSAAFAEPLDWTWAVRFLLALHEPVRHALFVMDRFLDRCYVQYEQLEAAPGVQRRRPGPGAVPKGVPAAAALEAHVADFFAWFKTCFVEFVRGQHELKTRVLLPLLSLKADAKRDVLDRYREAFQLVEQAQQLERALCVSRGACSRTAWLRRLDVLRREVRTLRASLLAALALEDRVLQPALSNTFTEHTFVRYVLPRVFRAVRAKRVLVPWVVERAKIWGGDREHASLLAMLPFSARLLYRKIWRPFFVSNVAVAMKRLLDAADDGGGSASASALSVAALGASASVGCGRAASPSPPAGGSERREERCGIQ